MRVVCAICTELFTAESTISALPCGHTFHGECVDRWLYQSRTCPQCRNSCKPDRIIHHLYFDQSDAVNEKDPNILQNELDSAKTALRQKDKEKAELSKQVLTFQDTIGDLELKLAAFQSSVKQEKALNVSLRSEVRFHHKLQREAEKSITTAQTLQKKLTELQAVSNIIKGSEHDVQEMINHQGSDIKQLATWCVVIQRELSTKRQECRTLRDSFDKLKREHLVKCRLHADNTRELASMKEQLKNSEDDLSHAEAHIHSLQNKTEALQKAIASPTATASSFAHRLINESPAPMPVTKRPKLSTPGNESNDFDLSMDLFPETESKPSPPTKEADQGRCTQSIRITSAAATTKVKREMQISSMANFNLFKKKPVGGASVFSAMRKGYNGLGGHESFAQPRGRSNSLTALKLHSSAGVTSKHGKPFSTKQPLLPTMSNFSLPD